MVLYSVGFNATKRGDEPLIQCILRLSNESKLAFTFQWGKTTRDRAGHLLTVTYDIHSLAICSVWAIE